MFSVHFAAVLTYVYMSSPILINDRAGFFFFPFSFKLIFTFLFIGSFPSFSALCQFDPSTPDFDSRTEIHVARRSSVENPVLW